MRSSGTDKAVVFRMRANPDPRDCIRGQRAESAIVVADANREAIQAALQSAEVERRMMRVLAPQVIRPDRELLNVTGQCMEQYPEAAGCNGVHLDGG